MVFEVGVAVWAHRSWEHGVAENRTGLTALSKSCVSNDRSQNRRHGHARPITDAATAMRDRARPDRLGARGVSLGARIVRARVRTRRRDGRRVKRFLWMYRRVQ